ncbi:MAG TPA: hypothetical protein VL527_03975 [Dongiaceae bacterium]|nr:hypothetical protein [Dongiaceae bacterium]
MKHFPQVARQRTVMKLRCLGWFGILLLLAVLPGAAMAAPETAATYAAQAAVTNRVATLRLDWFDASRRREVPVKIYYPADRPGRWPIIIFSHGLGGSRDMYEYLGAYWAAHGYVSAHVQHIGSDTEVWLDAVNGGPQAALRRAVSNVQNAINRPRDVSFAIDRLTALDADTNSPLGGRLDLARIGVAGHSFGAYTALAIAGQRFPVDGKVYTFTDPRVKAALPMSASIPWQKVDLDFAYGGVRIPCLHMTGTLDDSPLGETSAAQRRIPFDHCRNSDQYLLTLRDADHMSFAGLSGTALGSGKDALFERLICESSTAFFDAYLRAAPAAQKWLTNDFKKVLGADGVFEVRLKQ